MKDYRNYQLEQDIISLLERRQIALIPSKYIAFAYEGKKIALVPMRVDWLCETKKKYEYMPTKNERKRMENEFASGRYDLGLVVCDGMLSVGLKSDRESISYNLIALPCERVDDFFYYDIHQLSESEFEHELFRLIGELIEGDLALERHSEEYDLPW